MTTTRRLFARILDRIAPLDANPLSERDLPSTLDSLDGVL